MTTTTIEPPRENKPLGAAARGCSVGHTFRNFNPPLRLHAHARPGSRHSLDVEKFKSCNQTDIMKSKTIIAACCALLALLGCDKKGIAPSSEVGPFNVNSDTGMATGKAFGIEFNVAGASRADVDTALSGSPKSSSRTEITLADDLKIKLQTMNEGNPVTFDLNGKNFGTLQRGDKVEIGKSRNVMVNGGKRTSEISPPK